MKMISLIALAMIASAASCARVDDSVTQDPSKPVAAEASESHLTNVRQLTFGGENAEAYWSSDGQSITFQSTRDGRTCDQQYVMRANGSDVRKISAGGKTTCGFFYDGDRRVFFASSHAADTACPPRPDASAGYVWPLDPFDIYTVAPDGSDLQRLTNYGTYTAEGVLSPDGKKIVFTSLKDGDLDIYTMNVDGTDIRRLTNTRGYDGGPWWSPDGSKIVYRAHHPADAAELAHYDSLLARKLVRPSRVELFVMNADGSDQRQITRLGGANFGPSWTPDGNRIVFSSNYENPRSGNFDLYVVNLDGTGLERITTRQEFDGFPMFSPDGKKLIWASNRHAGAPGETNLFVAEWSH
jgi:Tol biopolymer transport system component